MTYKQKIDKMIKASGRKRIWLYKNSGIPQPTFWRKVRADSFNAQEKATIEKLLKQ